MMNQQEITEIPETIYPSSAVPERLLIFSGTRNFRDLGGYRTMDGRSVRWGRLYRSGSLHRLTVADLEHLSGLGLDRIVDFRSALEREREPGRIPPNLASGLVEIPILDSSTQLFQYSRKESLKNLRNIDAVHFMTLTYTELATRFNMEMRKFIDVLFSANGLPVLFHCTVGKDRTGFAAAITLRLLGVPPEIVMDDYLLTNRYFFDVHRWRLYLLRAWKGKRAVDTVAGMMRAHPLYLTTAFQAIDQSYGSFENYVRDVLGRSLQDVEHLRSLYLEERVL